MPVNNSKKAREIPVEIKFGQKPSSKFVNLLRNIKVSLVQAPRYEELKRYTISFATATYQENPFEFYRNANGFADDLLMHKIFKRELLPSTLETIRLNFLIEGISIQEVTHILRYRKATFSAECSGEKWWSDKKFVVPTSVENSDEFYARYRKICEDAKQLYCDMIDSKEISLRDARYILPRATETFYFMSMSLADAIHFIYDRIDTQIQPLADNVMAYQMLTELLNQYPILIKTFGKDILDKPAKFYVDSAQKTLGSNLYPPNKQNDLFEYNEKSFIYDKTRDKFNGTNEIVTEVFEEIYSDTKEFLKEMDEVVNAKYGNLFDRDITLEELLGKTGE